MEKIDELALELKSLIIIDSSTAIKEKDMNNVADFTDPDDKDGRTYREINNERTHKIPLKQLVEIIPWDDESKDIYGGVRMFVTDHTRDCDGTPLYSIGGRSDFADKEKVLFGTMHGFSEESLKVIN